MNYSCSEGLCLGLPFDCLMLLAGADRAVMDAGANVGQFKGWLMGFAWKGAETFMQISVKNMYLVSRDLIKTKLAGRDVSDV